MLTFNSKLTKKVLLFLFFINPINAKIVDESFIVTDDRVEIFELLKSRPELTLDHKHHDHFELYGPKGTKEFLKRNKIKFFDNSIYLPFAASQYPTPEEIEKKLKILTQNFPNISSLFTIGKSAKNRNLNIVKITSTLKSEDKKPKFKYIANMHGDEIVGRELMVLFINDLLSNYGKDQRITQLIDDTEIYIMPSMNPDGAAVSRRGNGNSVDLNRDFPDFTTTDDIDNPNNRQPETKAIMNWQSKKQFKLSANFHGGAEVVNYPWDTKSENIQQFDLIKDLSLEYAANTKYMAESTTFENGITNGYAWYEVNGGMQDWSIYWRNDLQITIELSNSKWPDYSKILTYYQNNREALIRFIERVHTF